MRGSGGHQHGAERGHQDGAPGFPSLMTEGCGIVTRWQEPGQGVHPGRERTGALVGLWGPRDSLRDGQNLSSPPGGP